MKTTVRHIIFEFTLQISSDDEIEIGIFNSFKEVKISKDVSAFGFILGESEDFITNQVIFYN